MCTIFSFLASKVAFLICTNIRSIHVIPEVVVPLQIHCKKELVQKQTTLTFPLTHTQLYIKVWSKKKEAKNTCYNSKHFSIGYQFVCTWCKYYIQMRRSDAELRDITRHELEKCKYIPTKAFHITTAVAAQQLNQSHLKSFFGNVQKHYAWRCACFTVLCLVIEQAQCVEVRFHFDKHKYITEAVHINDKALIKE